MRFYMIDRITSWEPGVRGSATKNITLSEDFFADHFPTKPIMPGVLMIEGMAQLSGLLLEEGLRKKNGEKAKAFLCIIDKTKFRTLVVPGDTIEYRSEVTSLSDAGGRTSVKAFRNGELVAECNLGFYFHKVDDPSIDTLRKKIFDFLMSDVRTNEKK